MMMPVRLLLSTLITALARTGWDWRSARRWRRGCVDVQRNPAIGLAGVAQQHSRVRLRDSPGRSESRNVGFELADRRVGGGRILATGRGADAGDVPMQACRIPRTQRGRRASTPRGDRDDHA
jgi:hypothetical protein